MNRKIVSNTVGTNMNPKKVIQQSLVAGAIKSDCEGKIISITDSADYRMLNLKAHGDTWQKQYEGHQLFDFENTDFVDKNDCTIKDGELYSELISYISIWIPSKCLPFESNEQVTVSAKMKCGTSTRIGIGVVYEDGSCDLDANRRTSSEYFTTSVTSNTSKKVVGIGFSYESSGSFWVKDIMVNKGTQALPYEIYVGGQPSPSPQYPQPIENLDKVEVKVLGKNLFDVTEASDRSNWVKATENGYIGFAIPCKPNTTYTISSKKKYDYSGVYFVIERYGVYFDEEGNLLADQVLGGRWVCDGSGHYNPITYETDHTGKILLLYANGSGQQILITDILTDIQIEHGTEATEYEPYTEQTLTIPYSLGSGDKIELFAESGKMTKGTKRKVFDGTEAWYQYDKVVALANWDNWETPQHSNNDKIGLMSNVAIEGTQGLGDVDGQFTSYNMDGTDWIVFNFGISVDEWKSYLAEQYAKGTPVYVQYPIAEPIETDIDIALDIHTNYPTTTIISNAEVEVEYVADTKNYIDNKFKELEANVTSAIAQLL